MKIYRQQGLVKDMYRIQYMEMERIESII